MKETWTPELVAGFNGLEPAEYIIPRDGVYPTKRLERDWENVVALAGGKVQRPEPEGLAGARIIAHQNERINTLVDLVARQTQQLQDELDLASSRGEDRPDLQALLDECDQVLEAEPK